MTIDESILSGARQGDETAFHQLVEKVDQSAQRIASAYTYNPELIKEIKQQAYIRCWHNRGKIPGSEAFMPWLATIIRNLMIDHFRKDKKRMTVGLDFASHIPHDEVVNASDYLEFQALIVRWAAGLPHRQRQVFMLREIEGHSVVDVRKMTGLSEGTIKSNLYITRKKLHLFLKKRGFNL